MAGLHPQRGECLSPRKQIEGKNQKTGSFADYHARRWQRWGRREGNKPDYWDFIWLIYSGFFFIYPIQLRSARVWAEFGVFYVIFLALYAGIILARRRWQIICIALMGILGVAYYPLNNGAYGCFIYAAAFLPFVVESLTACIIGFAALCITLVAEGILLHTNPWLWGIGAVFTVVVGGTNIFMAQRIRANAKLELAQEEIEQLAKVAERERIARDLHDVLGHTLSVIVLKSELAGRLISSNPNRAASEIADVESIARKALGEVREAITGYRSEGLSAEIQRAHNVLNAAGVTLICEENPPALSPTEETVLALALREAVTNVVRHAQATRCETRFVTQDGKATLVVEDNGRGGLRQEGNGLRGMRERIEALGGHFAIDSAQGTRLTIELPLKQLTASS